MFEDNWSKIEPSRDRNPICIHKSDDVVVENCAISPSQSFYPSVNAKMNKVLCARIHNMGAHHDDDERMNPDHEQPTTENMAKGTCL